MILELSTSIDCLGAHFEVCTKARRLTRVLRTVIRNEDEVVATVECRYLRGADVRRLLDEQHRRLVSQLHAGRLQLSPCEPTPADLTDSPGASGRQGSAARRLADHLPDARWLPAAPAHMKRVTVLALSLAAWSLAATGLSIQTARGLVDVEAVATFGTSPVDEPPPVVLAPRSFRSPMPPSEPANAAPRSPAPAPAEVPDPPAAPVPLPSTVRTVVDPRVPELPAPPVELHADVPAPEPAARQPPPPIAEPELPARPAAEQPEVRVVETVPGQLVDRSDVDTVPRAVKRELPAYTQRAKKRREEGRVELNLLIDERGRIADLRLLDTIPGSDLNEAAIEAAWLWRFEPARKAGVPVRVWTPVTIVFTTHAGLRRVFLLE